MEARLEKNSDRSRSPIAALSYESLEGANIELPEDTRVTSYFYARDAEGHRRIYIFLNPGETLKYRDMAADEPGNDKFSRVRVNVDDEGHRHWVVCLGSKDTLSTGRLEPLPPPPPPPGG